MQKALATDADSQSNIPLTRERLEQLATEHEFAPAAPLAQAWRFTAAEIQAIQAIEADAGSDNTDRSYATAKRYWHAWYWLRYQTPLTLPAPPVAVLRFIVDHVAHWPDRKRPDFECYLLPAWIEQQLVTQGLKRSGPWKPNTIEQRISVLSSMHDQQRDANNDPLINPCRDPYVIKLLRVVRRAHAKHDRGPVGRDAATVDQLEKMLEHCASDSLRDTRDRAVLLVGFASGGRRRSEIAGLKINDLVSDGDGFLWKLGRTKNSKGELEDVHKPIQDEAAAALKEWLAVSGITEASVFREIDWRGAMTKRPMSDQAVYRTVKRLAAAAQLKGAWGAHSLRSGFMTEAGRRRESMHEAMALSGHKSALVAGRYYRAQHASNSPAANFTAGMKLPDRTPAPARSSKPAHATADGSPSRKAPQTPPRARTKQRCLQLRIELHDVSPPVWRVVRVRADYTFQQLHAVLCGAMGWYGDHLYQFDVNGETIMAPSAGLNGDHTASGLRLHETLDERSTFGYAYDFGDGWYHTVDVLNDDRNSDEAVPVCVAGSGACPPEDVGGPGGYEIFKHQAKARRGDLYRWHRDNGGSAGWNPMIFSVKKANEAIAEFADAYRL